MRRSSGFVAVVLGALLGAGAATGERVSAADVALADATTEEELSQAVGAPRDVCVWAAADEQLCQWHLTNRHAGWRRLARAIDTRERIDLICALPLDGGPRAPGSCVAYPAHTNRAGWAPPRKHRRFGEARYTGPNSAELRRMAQARIDAAATLADLVFLVGAVPDECQETSGGSRVCTWRTSGRTYGHGMLARSIGSNGHKKVRLRCQLPGDGGPRPKGSCLVEIGS